MSTAERPVSVPSAVEGPADVEPRGCLNCGAPLVGEFCSECGQRDVPPYPTVRDLAGDAMAELSGWDGRFLSTIRALLRKPGTLTVEFLRGRRVRYISPLRLYLVASLVYFVVATNTPDLDKPRPGEVKRLGVRVGTGSRSVPVARVDSAGESGKDMPLTKAQRDSAIAAMKDNPAFLRYFLVRVMDHPNEFADATARTLPRMLFGLLPVFALILSVFYRRRRFPEHLYFSVHFHTFVFIALTLAELTKFTYWKKFAESMGMAALVAIGVYGVIAARAVYGGRIGATIVKGVGICFLYLLASIPAFAVLLAWATISLG